MNRRRSSSARLSAVRGAGTLTIVVCCCAALAAAAAAASVSLLPKFGKGGLARFPAGKIMAVATQRDGHVIGVGYTGGSMLVERVAANGKHPQRLKAGNGVANAVVVQPNGKIVVAGTTVGAGATAGNGDMVVKRFNANGTVDRHFASGGIAHSRGGVANAVALGPNGTIIVAGSLRGSDASPRVALARYLANGKTDRSFGNGGFAEIDLGPFSQANAVAVQRNGKIVFAGDQSPDLQVVNALIGRVSKNGRLDASFGKQGVYYYFHPHGGAASSFRAVTIDRSGKIVAAGGSIQQSPVVLLARLTPGGQPDGSFGTGGVVSAISAIHTLAGDIIGASSVAIDPKGEILAGGKYVDGSLNYAALWALTAGGRPATRVGPNGLAKLKLPALLGGEINGLSLGRGGAVYFGGDLVPGVHKSIGVVGRFRGL